MDTPQHGEAPADILGFYFVAFLDVMGLSDRWVSLTDLPQTNEEQAEAARVVGETVGFLRLFRKTFEDFATGYGEHHEHIVQTSVEAQQILAGSPTLFEFRFFSDSIIVSIPLAGNDEYFSATRRIFLALTGTIAAVVSSLARGQLVRGGLDVGLGVEVVPTEVCGPALISAYRLESRDADWSRVLIGDNLWRFLQQVEGQQPQTKLGAIAHDFAAQCLSLIATDQDGRKILDYLAEPLATFQAASKEAFLNTTLNAAYAFVRQQPAQCRQGNPKHFERAIRLLRYFDSRAQHWDLPGE